MLDIIVTYIVLHNLCIVNNERIEEEWIVGAKKKKAKELLSMNYKKTVNCGEKKLKLLK